MTPRSQSRFCYDLWQSWATASQFVLTRHRNIDVNASINSWYGVGKFKKMTCCWVMQQKFVRNSWHSPLLPPVSHLLYTISSLPSPISHLSSLFYPLSSSLFLTPLPSLPLYPFNTNSRVGEGWSWPRWKKDGARRQMSMRQGKFLKTHCDNTWHVGKKNDEAMCDTSTQIWRVPSYAH